MKDDLIKAIQWVEKGINNYNYFKSENGLTEKGEDSLKVLKAVNDYLLFLQSQPLKEDEMKIKKVKCQCPCHTNKTMKHIAPCCENGYITVPDFYPEKKSQLVESLYNKQIKTRQVLGQMYNDWLVFNNRKDGNYSNTVFDFFEAIGYFGEPLYNVVDEKKNDCPSSSIS